MGGSGSADADTACKHQTACTLPDLILWLKSPLSPTRWTYSPHRSRLFTWVTVAVPMASTASVPARPRPTLKWLGTYTMARAAACSTFHRFSFWAPSCTMPSSRPTVTLMMNSRSKVRARGVRARGCGQRNCVRVCICVSAGHVCANVRTCVRACVRACAARVRACVCA